MRVVVGTRAAFSTEFCLHSALYSSDSKLRTKLFLSTFSRINSLFEGFLEIVSTEFGTLTTVTTWMSCSLACAGDIVADVL